MAKQKARDKKRPKIQRTRLSRDHTQIPRWIIKSLRKGREIVFEAIDKPIPKTDKPIERTYDFTTMWKLTNEMVGELYNSKLYGRDPDWTRFKKRSA